MIRWIVVAVALVLAVVLYFVLFVGTKGGAEVEYTYEPLLRGELIRSTQSTGTLVPLTTVDVKFKAGGTILQLLVDEGSVVKKGDLIAIIDPAGRVLSHTGVFTTESLTGDVHMLGGNTLYSVFGDWPGYIAVSFSAIAGWLWRRR